MRVNVVSCRRMEGVGKESGKPYNLLIVGCVFEGERGADIGELMLDGAHPELKPGPHEVTFVAYPDQQKRIKFRADEVKPVAAQRAA